MALMQSLKFKIIAILIVTMAALLACQAFLVAPHIKQDQIADSILMQTAIADQIALDLDRSFRQAINELEKIAKLPGITSTDKKTNDETIATMGSTTQFFNYFFLMDKNGYWRSYPQRPQLVGTAIPKANMGWVDKTFAENSTIFLDVIVSLTNKLVSGFSTPILSPGGAPDRLLRGVLLVSEENPLLTNLKKIKIGANGYAFLVAANGWVLAHPGLKQSPDKVTIHDYSSFAPVKAVLQGRAGHLEYEYDNQNWLASFRPIPSTGWGIIIQQPVADIYGPIEENMAVITRFFMVSFALCILIMALSIRYILSPLTTLATSIANGDTLEPSQENYGQDEVGQLARMFRELFNRLRQALSAQEKSAAELWEYQDHLEELVKERNSELQTECLVRAEAEQALLASEEKLSLLISQSPLAIISWDIDFKVTSWNPAAARIFGWTTAEALGQHADFIVPSTKDNPVNKKWLALLDMPGESRNKMENITKAGQTIHCDWHNNKLINSKNEIIGVLSMVDDITHKARTEKDQFKIKKLESLGMLAGGIAHDFNNMLTGILGNINLALFDDNISDDTRQRLVRAENASHRAAGLTKQLLTFSKGDIPARETTSLADIIQDSAAFILHGDTVACRYNFPEDLWFVDADREQIARVVENIVLNASHSMPSGGTINISCGNVHISENDHLPLPHGGKFIKLTIEDCGIGMTGAVLEKVFDPYFTTKQEGSGLGLAVSHSIITAHGGHITVDSEPDRGTTFTIYLPATSKTNRHEKGRDRTTTTTTNATVMIMDDDETIKDVAKAMLTEMGHKTLLAANGTEAIQSYKERAEAGNPVDIIIMDLTIPGGMGGKEAVQKILAFDRAAKVIVSTGYSNDATMLAYAEFGFCGAIRKPYSLKELTRVINEALG